MKGLIWLLVLGLAAACTRPSTGAIAEATETSENRADSATALSPAAGGGGRLVVLRGPVRGVGLVSIYLLPKGPDSLGGTLIYLRPESEQQHSAYEVLNVSGKQRENLLWLNLSGRFDVHADLRGDLRGTLNEKGFSGEWRDATGTPKHQVQLAYQQMPYGLAIRTYSRRQRVNPLTMDLNVQWTEMVDPTPPDVRDAFNRVTHGDAEKGWMSFERDFYEEQRSIGNAELPDYASQRTLDQTDELLYADERLICLRQSVSIYMGGAHPMSGQQTRVFDVQAARFLEADELFADRRRPLNFLSDYCRRVLPGQLQLDGQDPALLGGTAPDERNFKNLAPILNGLLVQFNAYEVGPYSAGTPDVLIPWSEVQANARLSPAVEAVARKASANKL